MSAKKKIIIFFISIIFINLVAYILADSQNIRFKDEQVMYIKGYESMKKGDFNASLRYLEKLNENEEYRNSYIYNFSLGSVFYNQGKNEEAKLFFDKAMNIYPYAVNEKEFKDIYEKMN